MYLKKYLIRKCVQLGSRGVFLFAKKVNGFQRLTFRSSQQRCSIKRAVPKNFAIFTGKHLYWSLFWDCFEWLLFNVLRRKDPSWMFDREKLPCEENFPWKLFSLFSQSSLISQYCPYYFEKLNFFNLKNRNYVLQRFSVVFIL